MKPNNFLILLSVLLTGTFMACQPRAERNEENDRKIAEVKVEYIQKSPEKGMIQLIADSDSVCAGTIYDALVTDTTFNKRPIRSISWKQAGAKEFYQVESQGTFKNVGKIRFRAAAGAYDKQGNSLRKFVVKFEYNDTVPNRVLAITDTFGYIVFKPRIKVKYMSEDTMLYLNCGNKLIVQVPDLGAEYNPSFGVQGASKRMGKTKGYITIVPNQPKVVLSVSSGGMLVGKQEFRVSKVPVPAIELQSGGKKITMNHGLKTSGLSTVEVKVIPDPDFVKLLPADARYKVTSGTITLMRGGERITGKKISNQKFNIEDWKDQVKRGDKLVVELKKITRMNFLNKTETVPDMGEMKYEIPLY